jgi:hypothetical protein
MGVPCMGGSGHDHSIGAAYDAHGPKLVCGQLPGGFYDVVSHDDGDDATSSCAYDFDIH